MQTKLLVECDFTITIRQPDGTSEELEGRVADIPCTWVWSDCSRACAEYWAAADWIVDNMRCETFSIKCVVGSPV